MALRRVLHGGREPGERLIGWGLASVKADLSATMFLIALIFVPGIGHLIAAVAHSRYRRFVVLTDRRIVLRLAERAIPRCNPKNAGQTLDVRGLTVIHGGGGRRGDGQHFALFGAGLSKELTLVVRTPKNPASARRLVECLRILSR
jgi:hypothetical protein